MTLDDVRHNGGTVGREIRRKGWPDGVTVTALPGDPSRPWISNGRVCIPWGATADDMVADDWEYIH